MPGDRFTVLQSTRPQQGSKHLCLMLPSTTTQFEFQASDRGKMRRMGLDQVGLLLSIEARSTYRRCATTSNARQRARIKEVPKLRAEQLIDQAEIMHWNSESIA